ncbi:hypothetical protein C9374_012345 [Naegleria lovaniensis]|uniref:Uncharacterized protein n=1 Tax=Naegleria lovaniensis TaxID=51637 RepID=A0AA88GCT6_NAELO|nr:uncharacterized protein C9374_012345 [Naegleria lovaniensis]KAG2373242.1 hypothetical protein C9374_012345 [Naegleria lovaniensis]
MFTQRRQKNYHSGGEEINKKLEAITQKFADDLRKDIKEIKFPTMFSKEWVLLCDKLEKISEIVRMEREDMNFDSITAHFNKEECKKIEESASEKDDTSSVAVNDELGNHSIPSLQSHEEPTHDLVKSEKSATEDLSSVMNKSSGISRPSTASSLSNNPRKKKSNIQFGSTDLFGGSSFGPKKPSTTASTTRPSTASSLISTSSYTSSSSHSSVNHKQQAISTSFNSENTLWDRDEYCIRFLIEEGKINLLLRLLDEFKDEELKIRLGVKSLSTDILPNTGLASESELQEKMKHFEQSLCLMLKYCFHSVEALQTIDVYQYLDFINKNLREDLFLDSKQKLNGEEVYRTAEFTIFDFLRALFVHIDRLDDTKICTLSIDRQILPKAIRFLYKTCAQIGDNERVLCFEALSAMMNAETFQTSRGKFFGDDIEAKKMLVQLFEKYIKQLLTSYERKKSLRSLVDQVNRFKIEFVM